MATPASSALPEPLERRPEARTYKIEDLLAEVRRGRVRVPSFQRGLKWDRKDALTLLDSIYRGYPLGTLLFWETKADAAEARFGSVVVGGDARSDAWWVVDGQQRIVSLARTLLARAADADAFALYFDLDLGVVVPPPPATLLKPDPSRWLPLTEVLDSERLMQWVFNHASAAQSDARRERAFQFGKRIREYEAPAYIVHTDSEATLREVFGRINTAGRRLVAEEVFDALHGARSAHRPASIAQIAADLGELAFGRVDQKIIYRLLRVLHGADVTERSGDGSLRLTEAEAGQAYAQTAAAARGVVQFLKRDVGIPHYDLLPYKQPFVTLGKFFHHHPAPAARSRELLVRWLWRGALNGSHRGDTVSTRRALEMIHPEDEASSVQGMLDMVRQAAQVIPAIDEPFNFRHAAGKLHALALMDLAPRDLATGAPLLIESWLDQADTELPFPKPLSLSAPAAAQMLASVANRLAHPSRPGLRRQLSAVADAGILASHGVTEAAHEALRVGDSLRFLELRRDYLAEHFKQFFQRHARWEESDRPALASLLVAEDGD